MVINNGIEYKRKDKKPGKSASPLTVNNKVLLKAIIKKQNQF